MKKIFTIFFIVVGLILSSTGIVHADSLMLTASDFVPGIPNYPNLDCYIGWDLYINTGITYRYFFAPFHLPKGAQINSIVMYYQDNSTGYINLQMERRNMITLAVHDMADWSTSGEVSGLQNHKISPISYRTINTEGYTYWIALYYSDVGSELTVYGVKINYIIP